MSISEPAFQELADALGARHASRDDTVRASYAWCGIGAIPGPNKLADIWPSAVVLPGSTEEVQAVVQACNRHGMGFRAHSTGMFTIPYREGSIAIDLRRMDRIHEIDGGNQMAVIEPFVTVTRLQSEALKQGLTCHVVGAGPNHSPLASATAFFGVGVSGQTTGMNGRNLLAFEWVTPTGDIVRCGSAGSGAGWFSGEGPGPGFRGMLRGAIGTAGGLGVFTRIGYKLHPWMGPPALGITGEHPQLRMPVPQDFNLYQACWDDWEAASAAVFELKASRVANTLVRVPPDCIGYILMSTNEEYVERRMAGTLPPIAESGNGISWTILTAGESAAEAQYKDRVVRAIVERTGGRFVEMAPVERETMMLLLANSCYVHRVFRQAYSGPSGFGVMDSFSLLPKVVQAAETLMAEDKKPGGALASTHPDNSWVWPTEGRHLWNENVPTYRSGDARGEGAIWWFFLQVSEFLARVPLGLNAFIAGPAADLYGYKYSGVNAWMRKIKIAFDPDYRSDPSLYITPKKPLWAYLWPLLRPVIFFKPIRPLFKRIIAMGVRTMYPRQRP